MNGWVGGGGGRGMQKNRLETVRSETKREERNKEI